MLKPVFRLTAMSAMIAATLPISVSTFAEETLSLEEIVVTAQRREESLQDVPVAITAFGEDAIAKSDLDGVESLQTQVPGLVWADFAGQPQVTLRGIGIDIPGISSEPGVALNVDGVYQPRLSNQLAVLADLERIEVLRGPQGTLFGRNTLGGAINIFTKTPTGETEGNVSVLVGDEGHTRVRAGYSFPLIEDTLAARVSFSREDKDGFREDINTGQTDEAESESARVVINWTPTEDLQMTTRLLWAEDDNNGPVLHVGQDVLPFAAAAEGVTVADLNAAGLINVFTLGDSPLNDPRDIALNSFPEIQSETLSASHTIEWDLGNVIFKSTSSYLDYEYERLNDDQDGTATAFLENNQRDESHTWSQEFTLTSDSDGPLTWVAGINYYEDDVSGRNFLPIPAFGPVALTFNFDQKTEAWALFGQATYEINERTRATAGIRYSDEDKTAIQNIVQAGFGADCTNLETDTDYQVVTPKFAIDYDLTEDVLLYASATRGYKAGGVSVSACADTYDEELLWLYEAGFKGQFLDDRLRLNMLAFYTDYEDFQGNILVNGSGEVRNVPEAEIFGIEAELTALISNSFQIDASFSYLDTEQGSFISNDPNLDPFADSPTDTEGNVLPRSPEFSYSINASYNFAIGDLANATLRYEYSWSDDYFFSIYNAPFDEQDSFDVSNLRLIVEPVEVEGLSMHFYVNNLDDEDYLSTSIAALLPGTQLVSFADPRTYGVELHYNF